MHEIIGDTIKLTRGDSLVTELALSRGGAVYEPQEGDKIMFAIKSKLNSTRTSYIEQTPLFAKEIPTSDMTLRIDPADTKSLPFGSYCYDVEVALSDGTVDTVINNAPFVLMPEVY